MTKPSSIRPFSAMGEARVLAAAATRKKPASAMRPRYGRRNGNRPDSERGVAAAGRLPSFLAPLGAVAVGGGVAVD